MEMQVIAANLLWFLHGAWRSRNWKRSVTRVEAVQAELLRRLIEKNALTEFGKQHSFEGIDSVAAFQNAVPIRTYEDFLPYIEKIADGKANVLTADPVRRFGVSSGSTSASKLVPYTTSLIADFQEGIDPWMYNIKKSYPRTLFGKTYWSVTPVGEKKKYSAGGIPIGFDDERSYFGKLTQWVFKTVMAAPPELALVQDMDAFRYTTLRFLLQEKSLSWVSIWNPTFLTLFLGPLEEWFERLIKDVRTGDLSVDLGITQEADTAIRRGLKKLPARAKELSLIRKRKDGNLFEQIWPNMKLVSCWAHGNAGDAVKQLRNYFPSTTIQPKGLIATEAFVSFPLQGEASALSINSHFFEFEEMEGGLIRLAHQLEAGKKYGVIVTTNGGLYRYRLNDAIEVLDFEKQCPLIRFIGKQDKVVDVCGEKLNEGFVENVIRQKISQLAHQPSFWMVAPERSQSQAVGYTLFLQFKDGEVVENEILRKLGQEIDSVFRENFHYDYCRRLGQLQQCRVFVITPSESASLVYLRVCTELGQRLGDIKPVALHPFQSWSQKFKGEFVKCF